MERGRVQSKGHACGVARVRVLSHGAALAGGRAREIILEPHVEVFEDQVPPEYTSPLFQDSLLRMLGVPESFSQRLRLGVEPKVNQEWMGEILVVVLQPSKPGVGVLFRLEVAELVSKELSGQMLVVHTLAKLSPSFVLRGLLIERLREEKLYVKLSKCKFWLDSVAFLGHVVSKEGIWVDQAKIEAVRGWMRPTSAIDIQSFVVLVGYYRQFVQRFSTISSPFTILTRQSVSFQRSTECEKRFQKLKIVTTKSTP
ncbi:hypothetical protein MTR67_031594 [Solanum verrucosum]|uniref:Uncharacterized protein n=1 Tax=Solanum verrucosum TaxID=315347 RepID=A0AAF0ZHV1_SOLVR|nr:hypothetical protein MTR67_031594 [Solanum verrucosum]